MTAGPVQPSTQAKGFTHQLAHRHTCSAKLQTQASPKALSLDVGVTVCLKYVRVWCVLCVSHAHICGVCMSRSVCVPRTRCPGCWPRLSPAAQLPPWPSAPSPLAPEGAASSIGSGHAGAGAPCPPRACACACAHPCRVWGKAWGRQPSLGPAGAGGLLGRPAPHTAPRQWCC